MHVLSFYQANRAWLRPVDMQFSDVVLLLCTFAWFIEFLWQTESLMNCGQKTCKTYTSLDLELFTDLTSIRLPWPQPPA